MRASKPLKERLANELGLFVEAPVRVRRTTYDKSPDLWTWKANYEEGFGSGIVASKHTMQACVEAESLSTYRKAGNIVVVPETD